MGDLRCGPGGLGRGPGGGLGRGSNGARRAAGTGVSGGRLEVRRVAGRLWRALPLFAWLPAAAASPPAPASFPITELHLAASGLRLDHREFSDAGVRLDRDRGDLPGGALGLKLARGPWSLRLDAARHRGAADYEGRTNAGRPHATRSDEDLLDASLRVARTWTAGRLEAAAMAGLGWRRWRRDIRARDGVAGLDQTYTWPYATLGVTLGRAPDLTAGTRGNQPGSQSPDAPADRSSDSSPRASGARTHVGLEVEALFPFRPRVEVQSPGLIDALTLDVDPLPGWRLRLPVRHSLAPNWWLTLTPAYEHWRFGRGPAGVVRRDGRPAGTAFEPAGRSTVYRLDVGLARTF